MDEKNNNFNLKLIINDPYLHECRLERVIILDLSKTDHDARVRSSRNESTFPAPSHVFRTPMRPMSQQL